MVILLVYFLWPAAGIAQASRYATASGAQRCLRPVGRSS